MTTLITVYSHNRCIGRCDAKCYNAAGGACDCVCGGKNHGVGLNQAVENTTEICAHILDIGNESTEEKVYRFCDKVQLVLPL